MKKKARAKLRKRIGYTENRPDMCVNCAWYIKQTTIDGEYFQPRCRKFLIGVKSWALCDFYEQENSEVMNGK